MIIASSKLPATLDGLAESRERSTPGARKAGFGAVMIGDAQRAPPAATEARAMTGSSAARMASRSLASSAVRRSSSQAR